MGVRNIDRDEFWVIGAGIYDLDAFKFLTDPLDRCCKIQWNKTWGFGITWELL
jgi:hypothetical protein